MAAIRQLLGTVACLNPNCGVVIPVKQGDGGSVSVSCPYCDLSAYGKEGTKAKRDILALMKPLGGEAATGAEEKQDAPAAAPAPAPAPAKRNTVFG